MKKVFRNSVYRKGLLAGFTVLLTLVLIFSMSATMLLNATHVDKYRATVSYSVTTRRTSYTSTSNFTAAKEASAVLAQVLESSVVLDTLKVAAPALRMYH